MNPPGQRVYTVGHSFHYWMGPILAGIAESAGLPGHQCAGVMYLGGSTVENCWEIPNFVRADPTVTEEQPSENTAREALAAGVVDVLTLSPIWMPDEGIDKFAAFALAHNPAIRVTVQEFWLPNDSYEPVYPLRVNKEPVVDHDAASLPELRACQAAYLHDVGEYVRGVNRRLGHEAIRIVPVGQATLALREKIVAGEAPGIEKQSELFLDPWGHPADPLRVLSSYCHFAVIYGQSPVGLPMPVELRDKYRNDALNRLMQECAWEAVLRQPLSGVAVAAR